MLSTNRLLTTLSILHTFIGMVVVCCIYFFTIDVDYPLIDFIAALVPISFIIFKRCIHLDIHENIRLGQKVPEYTEDGYYFNQFQKFLFKKEMISKTHLKDFKGGEVTDIEHFCKLKDPKLIKDIFNEKVHYIAINSILVVILMTKYKMKKFIPLYLVWFFYNFSN